MLGSAGHQAGHSASPATPGSGAGSGAVSTLSTPELQQHRTIARRLAKNPFKRLVAPGDSSTSSLLSCRAAASAKSSLQAGPVYPCGFRDKKGSSSPECGRKKLDAL